MSARAQRGDRTAGPSWATYRQTIGDRSGLFAALTRVWAPSRALYPGSYLDLSPSTAIPWVTFDDNDRRAAWFFADRKRAAAELEGRTRDGAGAGAGAEVTFLHADHTTALPLPAAGFDLLISLYARPVWDHYRQYLGPGGLLLANTSHGDGSVAALDPRLDLVGAAHHRVDTYRLDRSSLDSYLEPKTPAAADPDLILRRGRGIAYTRTAFAYVFQLV